HATIGAGIELVGPTELHALIALARFHADEAGGAIGAVAARRALHSAAGGQANGRIFSGMAVVGGARRNRVAGQAGGAGRLDERTALDHRRRCVHVGARVLVENRKVVVLLRVVVGRQDTAVAPAAAGVPTLSMFAPVLLRWVNGHGAPASRCEGQRDRYD